MIYNITKKNESKDSDDAGRSDLNKQKRGFGRSLSFVFVFPV
jgi:hypothetical protein